MQRGTFQLMKSVNKSLILNKIRTDAPISRAQIAKETKLTPPTVSSMVKELLDQGIIRESEYGVSQGGRKPKLLHINSDNFYIIGVDAGPERIEGILSDLSGTILARTSSTISLPTTNQAFISLLIENIDKLIEKQKMGKQKIVGIGIAMHGVVDTDTGTSLFAPNLKLRNIPIKEKLEAEFQLPIQVENDARAMALGEAWFGGHAEFKSMVAVNIGRGVGSGVVIDGKLFHGNQNIAGEIGHMTIDINGSICECGNRGCLQTFITGKAISERAKKKVTEPMDELTGEKVHDLAVNGNQEAIAVFQETGKIIGIGLTNLIHLVNPEKIVLGGGVMKSEEFMLPVIKQTITDRALTTAAKQTEVVVTKLSSDATLLGAVALLLEELFDPLEE